MPFDFETLPVRRGTEALKWQVTENELPMWVADMDFVTPPDILEAIEERARRGVFGYSIVPDEWNEAVCGWWERRHGVKFAKEWLIFCCGVVPAVSSIVRKLTTPAEKVLLQTPVYNCFFKSITNNGREVIENELHYEDGVYSVDFADLEAKLADPQTSLMILCNPHNPVGKIWDRETLAQIGELCRRYGVVVVADEIHCDLTEPGCEYVPFASVSECCAQNSVTCVAPSKTFNLAGLKSAAVVVPNPLLRHKVWRGLNTDEVAEPNAFAIAGAVAAYTRGDAWLDALRQYLAGNRALVGEYLQRELPQVKLVAGEATYLLWLDCRGVRMMSPEFAGYLRRTTGLWVSSGDSYGKCGEAFVRLNVACPRRLVEDGLRRLKAGVESYEEWVVSQLAQECDDASDVE